MIERLNLNLPLFLLTACGFLLFGPAGVSGQVPGTLSDRATVSLLTITPGDAVYSAFGHSALRIQDPEQGLDIVFNYGTFDSTDPWFIPKFVYGQLDYQLSVHSMDGLIQLSRIEERSVIEQVLNLDAVDRDWLYGRLLENARPEKRIYRYDFLFENCSTKLLDLFYELPDERLRIDSSDATPVSFRELLHPYLVARPDLEIGIDLALGSRTDRLATFRERSFLPLELMRLADGAVLVPGVHSVGDSATGDSAIRDSAGDSIDEEMVDGESVGTMVDSAGAGSGAATLEAPFVTRTDTLLWIDRPERSRPGFPVTALIFWVLAGVWVISALARRFRFRSGTHAMSFRADRLLLGAVGFLGLFLLFMWFGTIHSVTKANWNLAWALPTHFVLAVWWKRISDTVKRYYLLLAVVLMIPLAIPGLLPQALNPSLFPFIGLMVWRFLSVAFGMRRVR